MAVEVRFLPEPDELARVTLAISREVTSPALRLGVSLLPLATGLPALFLAPGGKLQGPWLAFALSGSLAFGVLWLLGRPLWQRRRLARELHSMPAAQQVHVLTVGDDGLRVHAGSADTVLGWDLVTQVRETPEFYLFFYSRACAVYLPKRLLDDATDRELRALVRHVARDRGAGLAQELPAATPAG